MTLANGGKVRFTPSERKILRLLQDGEAHLRDDILACIGDSQTDRSAVAKHMCLLRAKLIILGQDISCVLHKGKIAYRQFKLLNGDSPFQAS
jgi:hypothetical protein